MCSETPSSAMPCSEAAQTVALGVAGRVELRRGGVLVVGAQVQVVVGQHRMIAAGRFKQSSVRGRDQQDRAAAFGEQELGDAKVERGRHLDVLGAERHDDHAAAGALDQRGVVCGLRRARRRRRRARARARRGGTPVASGPPTAGRGRASRGPRRRRAPARLIVSVTGAAAIAASASGSAASASITASRKRGRQQRAGGVMDEHQLRGAAASSACRRPTASATSHRDPDGAPGGRSRPPASRRRSARWPASRRALPRSTRATAGRRARRAPSGGPRRGARRCPAATIRATAIGGGAAAHAPCRWLARARESRYLPAAASWLLAESASSSSR